MTSAKVTRWLSALLDEKIGLRLPPKKRSRRVSLRSSAGEQVGAVVVAGRVLVQRLAVGYHRTFQLLVEQAQARDQAMDGAQHGAGDIVGVNLVARHH